MVGVDRFSARSWVSFVLQRQREPVFRGALRHDANLVGPVARVEVDHNMARDGLEARAVMFHNYVAAVGENAQLGKRRLHLRQLFVQRDQRAAQAVGGDALLDELFRGAQRDQIAKVIKFFGAAFARRNQLQALPVVELLVGDVQDALELSPAKSISCSHGIAASISPAKLLFSTAPNCPLCANSKNLSSRAQPRDLLFAFFLGPRNCYPAERFFLDVCRSSWRAAAAGTARTGGFLAEGCDFSAMLFFRASIRSMTGAILACGTAATSWPACFASISAFMLS